MRMNEDHRMESTRLGLTFEQLKIYYEERGLKLNAAFMKNLELLTPEGKPNYAAYLLADENGVSVQVAKYADTTRVNLIENRDFGRCCLVKSFKNVMDRMQVENTIYTKIGVPLRHEREMISGIAMREAVVNAIVHNDYSNGSVPKFEFFSDRLEITSAGGLPYGLELEDFFSGHTAPRNKEIMRIFRDLELVEHMGSGTPRILEVYGKEAFQISRNFFRLVFPYAEGLESRLESNLSDRVLAFLLKEESGKANLARLLGHRTVSGELHKQIHRLMDLTYVEMTIPEKPNSRLQKYRLTKLGREYLKKCQLLGVDDE